MTARMYARIAAVVAWLGLLLQCYLSLRLAAAQGRSIGDGLISFFGFFTVTTNLLVCLGLTVPSLAPDSRAGRFFAQPFIVAGIAASIAFVAVSYYLLLRNLWNPQGAQWLADVLLHYAAPALFIGYWAAFSQRGLLRWRDPLIWSVYPVAYFVYAMVRGEIIHSYPYGFIDVAALGYQKGVSNGIALLVAFICLGCAVVALDRWRSPRQRPVGA